MKLKNAGLIMSIFVNVVFLSAVIIGFFWLNKNTSIFRLNLDKDDIKANNDSSNDNTDYSILVSQKINVPENFKNGAFFEDRFLNLPEQFKIELFATNIPSARGMVFDDENNLYVTSLAGSLYVLTDSDNINGADKIVTVDSSLKSPHGIDFYNGDLYVAEENQVIVYKNISADGKFSEKKVVIPNLPTGGHVTRTVKVGPDKKLYVAVGSSCNLCEESDFRRAAITRYNLDGSGEELFASGLRNTVDFIFRLNAETLQYQIFGVDNGRDRIGDDIPPEEINLIEKGGNYGWPFCYGKKIANPEYQDRNQFCIDQTKDSYIDMQAHSAPLGVATTNSQENFPEGLIDNAFIAFHGSWNRTTPTGYKVVTVNLDDSKSVPSNFITGWLTDSGEVWGRPVDTIFDSQNNLYVSDDKTGSIYKIVYSKPE